jgi:hypothetical protein
MSLEGKGYRERKRAYSAAPAAPTRPRTAVGHSGESIQPVWAWAKAGMSNRDVKNMTFEKFFMCWVRLMGINFGSVERGALIKV